ncbi:hypothetical protein WDU94_005835 [Cyamophila willieti]
MAFCFLILFLAGSVYTLKIEDIKTKDNIIVVYGLPQNKTENLARIVLDIGHKIGIKHPLKQVRKAYRSEVPNVVSPKPIVIHLLNEDVKIDWVLIYQHKKRNRLLDDEVWWLINGLVQEAWILKGETDIWTREKKYAYAWRNHKDEVWYVKNITNQVLEKAKFHRVVDMEHLHYLRKNESHFEISCKPQINTKINQSLMDSIHDDDSERTTRRPYRRRKPSTTLDPTHEGLGPKLTRRPYRRRKPSTTQDPTDDWLEPKSTRRPYLSSVCAKRKIKLKKDKDSIPYIKSNHTVIIIYDMCYRSPNLTNENILKTVEHYGHKLGFKKPLDDIVKAYRSIVPTVVAPLVIDMKNMEAKDKWIDAYTEKEYYQEKWYLLDLGLPRDECILREEAEEWKDMKNYTRCWFRKKQLTVFYKKNETSGIYRIKDMEHLHHLYLNESHVEVTDKTDVERQHYLYLKKKYFDVGKDHTNDTQNEEDEIRSWYIH